MGKIYQPFIVSMVDEIMMALEESKFFEEHELKNQDFAREYISNNLTQKFINGQIDSQTIEVFDENEFDTLLKDILVGTVLYELKQKGFVNSYEDDNTEEIFFLTKEGKEYLKNILDNNSI